LFFFGRACFSVILWINFVVVIVEIIFINSSFFDIPVIYIEYSFEYFVKFVQYVHSDKMLIRC